LGLETTTSEAVGNRSAKRQSVCIAKDGIVPTDVAELIKVKEWEAGG
jgi:hypothetical protein